MLKFWVLEPAWEGAGPENSTRYFAVWDKGYLQPWNEWQQVLHPRRWNWVTFSFAHIEAEYARYADYISFGFVILGLGFRFHHTIGTEEALEASQEGVDKFFGEMEARSTQTKQLEKLWAMLPDDVKSEHVEVSLREQIELGLSEPEEGTRKVIASPQVLDTLGEILE
jgi:hypothetical protein